MWTLLLAEVPRQLLDLIDTGILDLPARDLLDGANGDTAALGNGVPIGRLLELVQDVLMNRFHSEAQHIPTFGYVQPTFGDAGELGYAAMKGQTKRPKYTATRTRRIIAAAILSRMEVRYRGVGDKFKALAEDAGTSLSTVQRATNPDQYSTGITVDVLTQLAMGLRCEPYELLTPSAPPESA